MSVNVPSPDPITIEILANALQSVTDEAFIALMKSAYSTNIKERHDHSCAIVDRRGKLVSQASNSIPVHIASVLGQMEALFRKFDLADIEEGDIFAANDPHEGGGTHLPDVSLAMPVFIDGELLGFVCNIAHHADIGGMSPGSMAGGMNEIYQEGLRIPVIKLFRRGKLDQDLAGAMMSINAVKGVEIGAGFASIRQKGGEHGDEMTPEGFLSNNNGGVLGGISTGQNLTVSIALKPTSSIRVPRRSVDVHGAAVTIQTEGRHDPCVGIRAAPIAEGMMACVLMDHALRHRAQCGDVVLPVAPVPGHAR